MVVGGLINAPKTISSIVTRNTTDTARSTNRRSRLPKDTLTGFFLDALLLLRAFAMSQLYGQARGL
jgi:hypothetical protein